MKLCWDNIENVKLSKNGNFRDNVKKTTLHYHEKCSCCGEPFLGKKNDIYCTLSCSTKAQRADPNSIYNTDLYREKHREAVKKIVNDPNGPYKTPEYKKKQSETKKNQWADPNSKFNTLEYKKKHRKAVKKATNTPEYKEKVSIKSKSQWADPNSKFHTPEFKEKHRKAVKKATNTPEYKEKVSGINSCMWKGGYNSKGIPTYDTYAPQIEWCAEVRRNQDDPNILEVKCFKCGEWFIPKLHILWSKIQILKGNDKYRGYHNFYCSNECRNSCSIYGKSPETIMKEDAIRAGNLPWLELDKEVQPELRKLVLERDEYQCIMCGEKENLQCHHIYPVNIEPLLSADIDNCITLCIDCHKKVHQKDGCKYNQLKMEEC